MSNSVMLTVEIQGFEDPFFLKVDIEGFEDPFFILKKMGFFDRQLAGKITVRGHENQPVQFRSGTKI